MKVYIYIYSISATAFHIQRTNTSSSIASHPSSFRATTRASNSIGGSSPDQLNRVLVGDVWALVDDDSNRDDG